MKFPSASKLQLAMSCRASSFLPKVESARQEQAKRGTGLHAVIDAMFNDGMDAAMRIAKENNVTKEFLDIDQSVFNQGLDDIRTEVAFEYDIFAKDHKDYGRNGYDKFLYGNRIRGVCDLVGYSSGILTVIDWKTGHGPVPTASGNWQLIIAALVFRHKSNTKNAIGKIVRTVDGVIDQFEYDSLFLDLCEEKIADFAKGYNPEESRDKYHTGDWCKYCPGWMFCPAQTGAIARSADLASYTPITEANVLSAIESIRNINDLSKKAEGQVRNYIELIGGRLVGPNGKVYIPAVAEGKIKRG